MNNTSEQFRTRLMVLEERQDHAENTRYLVMTKILNPLGGFVDIPRSVQFFKSELHVVLIFFELRYRCTVHVETRILLLDCDIQRPKSPRG